MALLARLLRGQMHHQALCTAVMVCCGCSRLPALLGLLPTLRMEITDLVCLIRYNQAKWVLPHDPAVA